MLEIVNINLDNELDLPLTHRRALAITKYVGLPISTQTTFSTAISEAARAVMEKTLGSLLSFRFRKEDQRWFLNARITTEAAFTEESKELKYARRLIPVLEVSQDKGKTIINLKLGLPRSSKISGDMASRLCDHIKSTASESPYEEIKQRNQELYTLSEQQEEKLRLAALLNEQKSDFLSIASHELRSPLTLIKAYAQMGKTFQDKDPQKMGEYLEKINQQASKVNTLIQQLLDVAKIENHKIEYRFETVDVYAYLQEILEAASLLHTSHIIVGDINLQASVNIDRLRMEQVFVNLIGNAVKYSGKGKQITVTAQQEGEKVIFNIQDQGIGLSPGNLTKVFDKFFRAEEVAQNVSGLGMGLFITSRIVQGHHGHIWVESKENEGSVFSFSLPAVN
jgi:signal transduction histidine kinase